MQPTTDFTGLSMPVFTAFGWAGEETAIKFALSQLEAFVSELHANLSREVKEKFPDAFIVAVKKGKIISLQQAFKESGLKNDNIN